MLLFLPRPAILIRMNDWTGRLRKLGITQAKFAARLGVSPQAVRHGFTETDTKPLNKRYIAMLEALELMTPAQRKRWLDKD